MAKIWLKPHVGDVVVWKPNDYDTDARHYVDTVTLIRDHGYRYPGSYLKHIYLQGGCMVDQRHIVAVLPPGSRVLPGGYG